MDQPVPDYLRPSLNILFVGYNPSLLSGETGHHYANPTNRFWKILHLAGLTPREYKPQEDCLLLDLGYGFTNIVARPTRSAAEITRQEYQEGQLLLKNKIKYFQPSIVCFVGKGVYQEYSEQRHVKWGIQEQQIVAGVIDFVAPSTSGLVRMRLDELLKVYAILLERI